YRTRHTSPGYSRPPTATPRGNTDSRFNEAVRKPLLSQHRALLSQHRARPLTWPGASFAHDVHVMIERAAGQVDTLIISSTEFSKRLRSPPQGRPDRRIP